MSMKAPWKKRQKGGFTLIEVAIAVVLIVMVGTAAIASLRVGMKTMGGTESAATAAAAIREFREFTFQDTIEDLDARDDQSFAATLGSGGAMPGADDFTLLVDVQPVDDDDPAVLVTAADSRSRVVTVTAFHDGTRIMEAAWLVAEH
jgi:prepilin-type N-terminal cleavage/methylation domain-containing protein